MVFQSCVRARRSKYIANLSDSPHLIEYMASLTFSAEYNEVRLFCQEHTSKARSPRAGPDITVHLLILSFCNFPTSSYQHHKNKHLHANATYLVLICLTCANHLTSMFPIIPRPTAHLQSPSPSPSSSPLEPSIPLLYMSRVLVVACTRRLKH